MSALQNERTRTGQGAGSEDSIANIIRPTQNTPTSEATQQPPLSRAFVIGMARSACRAAEDAMLRAASPDQVAEAAWRWAVCNALACRLSDASGLHSLYTPGIVSRYARHSAGRVRLAREYAGRLADAADEAARVAIAEMALVE